MSDDDDSPPRSPPVDDDDDDNPLAVFFKFQMVKMQPGSKMRPKMKQPQPSPPIRGARLQRFGKVVPGKMAPMVTPDSIASFITNFTQAPHYREQDMLDRQFHCRAIEDALREGHRQQMVTIRANHQADIRDALASREVILKAVNTLIDTVTHKLFKIQQAKKEKNTGQVEVKKEVVMATASNAVSAAPDASKKPDGPDATCSVLPTRTSNGGATGTSKESIYRSLPDLSKDGHTGKDGSASGPSPSS